MSIKVIVLETNFTAHFVSINMNVHSETFNYVAGDAFMINHGFYKVEKIFQLQDTISSLTNIIAL